MSFINDLPAEIHNESVSVSVDSQTASVTGSGVDVTSGDPVVAFIQGTYTDGTFSYTISGSDDGGSSWTSVSTGEKLNGTVPTLSGTTNEDTIKFQEVQADANYDQLRVTLSESGSTTGAVCGAHILEINETTS